MLHPWWREAALVAPRVVHSRRGPVAASLGACAVILGGMWLGDRAYPVATAASIHAAFETHAGMFALLLGLAAYTSGHRLARSRVDAMQTGWWRAAPVHRASIDVSVLAMCVLLAVAATVVAAGAIASLAWLAGQPVPIGTVRVSACAIAAGCVVAAVQVIWRRRHPPVTHRAGVRVPLLAMRGPRTSAAPHLFDWQRRETVVRWRRGGNIRLIGVALVLMPGATHPAHVAGMVLLAGAAAWWGTVIAASGDVAAHARLSMKATPIDAHRLRRAGWRYPALALGIASLLFACGTLMVGVGSLAMLWAAVACVLSLGGLMRLARIADARDAP